jgi:hypothetical protein
MHRTTRRHRAAAALYGTLGAAMLLGSVLIGSILLAVVGAVMVAFGVIALRSFPFDGEW